MADKQALEAAKKQQQDFLASIAHELRTPLNGIIGLSDALFKSEQNKGRSKHLKMIFSCANRLVGLVNMIMDITALRDGKLNLTVNDSVSFNEICEEVQELMINAVDKNGKKIKKESVDLQIDLDPSAPTIQGDRERLTQVVYNLVNNALKFTEGGFVKMSTKFDQGTLLFCCSDSGKGIKKENFKKIFEAFGQEEEGKGGGLGLGLAIVTKILDLHGGKIWVESELGKGAQFWVRLPLKMDPNALASIKAEADAKAAVEEAAVSGGAAASAGGGAGGHATHGESDDNKTLIDDARARLTTIPSKIMIIDHDNDRLEKTRKIVSSHAECPNPTIITATDGVKGLSQIDNANLPDLILVDSDIPGQLSAFDVINTLRTEQSPDLNIVAICADAGKQMLAIKSLATSTIIRPWSSDEFFSCFFYETLLAQTMIKLDRENKIGIEMMGRLLPHSIAQKMTKQTNAIMSETYKGISVLTIMIREFDQIVALIPISQVSVLLNRIQAAIDSCLSQFDVVRLDSAAASSAGEFVIVCGHDRQEDHVDKVMGYGKRILTLIGNGNLKIAGHAVEFLVGVDSSTGVGCVVSGISSSAIADGAAAAGAAAATNSGVKSSSPRYLVFGQAIELSRRLCITGVANHVHVSKSVADKINEEYEGSGLYDFGERGVLGDGELGVPTFVLKLTADENGEGFKSTSLNSTLSQFFEGSPGQLGTCSGSSNTKDQMEEYEAKMKLLELRLGIMRGVDGSEAIKAIEAKILKTGSIPATALLAITDPIEQVLNSIERIVGHNAIGTDAAVSPPPLIDDIARLEKDTEDLGDEIESIQKTAREARKQVHQAIATAAIGSSKSSSIGVTKQGAESMGIVLDDMIEMIEEIDSKLNVSGFLPASASNGELHKLLSDLTIEVESVSSSIDKSIRFYTEMGAGGGSLADLNALKQMSEQVHQLKLEIAKKDQVLAGMPINGGIPKEEAMSMLQELMGFQQECRTLHLEIEWYQEKIAELSGTNSKLLEDNRTLAGDIREAKNILDEQERTIRHQQLQLTQASSMSEFHQPAIPGYFRPYGQSPRGHSLPPGGRLSSIRTPGPQAGTGLYHWAQMSGFNFNPSLAQMGGAAT